MDGHVIIGTELDTKNFDEEIRQTEIKLNKLEQAYSKAMQASGKTKPNEKAMANLRLEIEKTSNKLITLRKRQDDLNKSNISKLPQMISGIGSQVSDVITKMGKWTLAIFGIRTAYNLIRGAISTLSSENQQIATDIEYMRWILAQTLKPVVEWIIKGLYFIISLINSISMSIFNVNILSGKSADQFKKVKQTTGGIASNLKDAKKQLAGFDEMNVLQDTSSSSGGGGGGGVGGADMGDWTPPDLSNYTKQIEGLKKNWMDLGKSMEFYLKNVDLMTWFKAFGLWGLAVRGVTQYVYGLWNVVTGAIQFVKGAIELIYGLITGDTEKIKQGIHDMLTGLTNIIKGFFNMWLGIIQIQIGVIIGVVGTMIKFVWNLIASTVNDAINLINRGIDKVKGFFSGVVSFIKNIVHTVLGLFGSFGTKVGDAVGGAFKSAVNFALSAIDKLLNTPIRSINSLIDKIKKVPGMGSLKKLNTISIPRLAKGGIVNMPGSGVMIGGAIAGERGAEGVIPLTDSQQMALLGEAIGRYITVNANITNTMNGRVISRELQKVQNDNDFAYNR